MRKVVVILYIFAIISPLPLAGSDPSAVGQWTEPFEIQGDQWVLPLAEHPMHAVVLPTGNVLIWRFGFYPVLYHPATMKFTRLPIPPLSGRLIGCTAHLLLDDGRVFIAGGTTSEAEGTHTGHPHVMFFNPFVDIQRRNPWTIGPDMPGGGRWYPGAITLADGRILVTSGYTESNRKNEAVVIYNPTSNSWASTPQPMPQISNYPFLYNLLGHKILVAGNRRGPLYSYDYTTFQLQAVPSHISSGRHGGSTTVFWKDHQMMTLMIGGGSEVTPHKDTEYGQLSSTPAWRQGPPLHYPRYHPNAVTLPTNEILVIGGDEFHDHETGRERPVRVPELLDPDDWEGGWRLMAPHKIPRGAHSMALLLPDASVLVLGGDKPTHQPQPSGKMVEIYYPYYFYKGPRPYIVTVPAHIKRNGTMSLTFEVPGVSCVPRVAEIKQVVFIPLPSVTHSYNFNKGLFPATILDQKLCHSLAPKFYFYPFQPPQLTDLTDQTPSSLTFHFTESPSIAPPGYYYLFLISGLRIPSPAVIVHIGNE